MQAAADFVDLAFKRHADELRATWQARVLTPRFTVVAGFLRPRDLLGACLLSVLAHNYDDAMPVLLRVVFPGFESVGTPMLVSAAKVAKTGQVMADIVTKTGRRMPRQALFATERIMEKAFREIADDAKLTDAERIDLFDAIRRWVVCDYRLDPTMDSADPDAKRLTVH